MSGLPNPWAEMFARAQKLAREVNPALESFVPGGFDKLWPTLPREVMELVWGERLNPGGLDARTRLLVVLAGLTVQGAQAEPQFRATVRHALAAGATRKEIAEVILQMALLGGLPAMNRAMQMAESVFSEEDGSAGAEGSGADDTDRASPDGERDRERGA